VPICTLHAFVWQINDALAQAAQGLAAAAGGGSAKRKRQFSKNVPLATRTHELRDSKQWGTGGTHWRESEKEYTEEQRARDAYLRTALERERVHADDLASGTRIAQLQQTVGTLRDSFSNERKLLVDLRAEVRGLQGGMQSVSEANLRLERKLDLVLGNAPAAPEAAHAAAAPGWGSAGPLEA